MKGSAWGLLIRFLGISPSYALPVDAIGILCLGDCFCVCRFSTDTLRLITDHFFSLQFGDAFNVVGVGEHVHRLDLKGVVVLLH